jgi:hypothetical protein
MAVAYTISGAALKDSEGNDFMVASLPTEYIPDDAARRAWQDHFRRQFDFPVVIAFLEQPGEWTLRGQARLLRLLKERSIDALPWQRILVDSKESPPISYEPPAAPNEKV